MRRYWLVALAVAVAAVGLVGVAAAAPGKAPGGFWCWGGMGPWMRGAARNSGDAVEPVKNLINELGLTDEQLSRIRQIESDSFAKMQELRASMSEKLFEMRSLYWQREPDEDAIAAKQKEISAIREQMTQIRQQAQEQLTSVLTEEQQQKLKDLKAQWRGKQGAFGRRFMKRAPASGDDSSAPGVTTN